MKSGHLFLFKTERINITNLFQFCLYQSAKKLYKPCTPKLSGWVLSGEEGGLVYELADNGTTCRSMDLTTQLPKLQDLTKHGQQLVIGNFNIDQLIYIKHNVACNATIISYTYDQSMYELLLKHFALTHIHGQNAGTIVINEYDRDLRERGINLVDAYMQLFDTAGYVPKSLTPVGDYSVPVADFFNYEKFFDHYKHLQITPSTEARNYYTNWHNAWVQTYGEQK